MRYCLITVIMDGDGIGTLWLHCTLLAVCWLHCVIIIKLLMPQDPGQISEYSETPTIVVHWIAILSGKSKKVHFWEGRAALHFQEVAARLVFQGYLPKPACYQLVAPHPYCPDKLMNPLNVKDTMTHLSTSACLHSHFRNLTEFLLTICDFCQCFPRLTPIIDSL